MSNLESPDPRMRNGWAEYQRLVLAELERHGKMIEDIITKMNKIDIQLARNQDVLDQFQKMANDRGTRLDKVEAQIASINKGTDIDDAVSKYRKYIFGGLFLLLTSVAIPLAKVFLGLGA